jgi:hypothetical protein
MEPYLFNIWKCVNQGAVIGLLVKVACIYDLFTSFNPSRVLDQLHVLLVCKKHDLHHKMGPGLCF